MRNNFGAGNIEAINPKKLTEVELLKMYEIERDTWSYFMGEYVKCKDCNKIFSKRDIYGEIDDNYKEKTVIELEKEYGRENIRCKCCNGETEDIRGEELIKALESRIFGAKKSFINFYKGKVDEILGFSYGFIDSPEGVYEKEFSYHFNEKLLSLFQKKFGDVNLLTLSGVCIKPEMMNIKVVYELIKQFHCILDSKYHNAIGFGEAIIGTPAHKIYKRMGCNYIKIDNSFFKLKLNNLIKTEIVYQENVVEEYKKIFNMNLRSFLSFTKRNYNII